MRLIAFIFALSCVGCHDRIRVASPQFQKAPEIKCIVIIEADKVDSKVIQDALNACGEKKQ